jgi:hypothetical protein
MRLLNAPHHCSLAKTPSALDESANQGSLKRRDISRLNEGKILSLYVTMRMGTPDFVKIVRVIVGEPDNCRQTCDLNETRSESLMLDLQSGLVRLHRLDAYSDRCGLHWISARYERGSLFVTSNLPFSDCGQIFQGGENDSSTSRPALPPLPRFRDEWRELPLPESLKTGRSRKSE